MAIKIAENMYLEADTASYTLPVDLGGNNNSALFEVWVLNARGTLGAGGVNPVLQGSNDGLNWTPVTVATTDTASPSYKSIDVNAVIAFPRVRLKLTATSQAALVDLAITPYKRS
ncbi:MAG: hypothetical protein KC583_24805 [Myxococcales bacterium]|nr:hypothetical protein [Myxococcales bacterium]